MASQPTFTSTPRLAVETISTANTNLDGTGTITTIVTGVAAGTRINEVIVKAAETTTDGMIRLFLTDDSGTTWYLLDEFYVAATTASSTQAAVSVSHGWDHLILPSTAHRLGASTHNAESFNVIVNGADLT